METKICTKCNLEQDIDNFYVRKKGSDKRVADCKECQSKAKARKVKYIPDLEGEIWKDFVGLENVFVVSNKGRIRRIMHRKNPTNRLMKQFLHPEGYFTLPLSNLGEQKFNLVHRAVAIAFIDNPLNLPEVNHKDGNKTNNCVENLEWVTKLENIRDAWRTGLSKPKKGENHGCSKLTEKEVLEIRAIGRTMSAREIATLYGVNEQAIHKIRTGQRWKHLLTEEELIALEQKKTDYKAGL